MQDGIDLSYPATGLRDWALICQPSHLMRTSVHYCYWLGIAFSRKARSHWHTWRLEVASEIGIVDMVGTILASVLRQKHLSYVVGAATL